MRGILIISWDQFMRPLLFVPLHVSSLLPADWYVNPLILPVYTGFFSTFKWKLNSLGKPYQNLQPGPGGVSLVLEMLFIYYWLKQEWSWLRHHRLARTAVTCDVWCVMCECKLSEVHNARQSRKREMNCSSYCLYNFIPTICLHHLQPQQPHSDLCLVWGNKWIYDYLIFYWAQFH